MQKIQFYPLDATYRISENRPVIYLFGRTADGRQLCVLDDSFEPYFYVIPRQGMNLKEKLLAISVEEGGTNFLVTNVVEEKKLFNEKEAIVLKVFVNLPAGVPAIRRIVDGWDSVFSTNEYDIPFVRRYLIDKGITPMTLCEAEGEFCVEKLKTPSFKAAKIVQATNETVKPRILGLDIETYNPAGKRPSPDTNPIVMLALYGENFRKVLVWKRFPANDYVEFVQNEAELIERFKQLVAEYAPDIITGYFSDGFDFPYIQARAKKYRIKLDLGIDYSELKVSGKKTTVASITGIPHIDIFKFVRRTVRNIDSGNYTLDSAAHDLLGEAKHDAPIEQLAKVWDESPENLGSFCDYNLHDAKLAFLLCTKLLPNIVELVKIVGLPAHEIIRMSFSQLVEWYILRQAFLFNEVSPNRPDYKETANRLMRRIQGAFVLEPTPGLFRNIAVLDYRSLYPTIIASHNISPGTLNCGCCEGTNQVPTQRGNFWFCTKRKGFLSSIIEDIIVRRARIKAMLKKGEKDVFLAARSEALKVLANSFYGYLGFSAARWYCIECAESTTAWARHYVKKVIESARASGFRVLYADTDSCFLLLGDKTTADVVRFVDETNKSLPGIMELELQGFYPAGLFVAAKGSGSGAKKKYALLDSSGAIKITGFETVRRNWSFIAKDVQRRVLEIILKEGSPAKAVSYVKGVIDDLKHNRVPLEKVVIHTQLQKPIENYDSTGPHVAAAQRMRAKGVEVGPGVLVRFVVIKGKGRIRDKVRLPDETSQQEYDGDYYINNQVVPGVDKILEILGCSAADLVAGTSQSSLDNW